MRLDKIRTDFFTSYYAGNDELIDHKWYILNLKAAKTDDENALISCILLVESVKLSQ